MGVLGQMLGESAPIASLREQAGRVLQLAAGAGRRLPPILILGETGTGKGLLAGALHAGSARAAGPFVGVNCAAIPETLLEAELFGYERGAFTDARQAKPGLFQAASGGTIFLDEVGLLPLALQAKLLTVIEERAVRRLGSTRSEALDVALIAATNLDLATAARDGRFRSDLYHRLAVVTLSLPPLRERGRDVVLLAEEFLGRVCEDYGLTPRVLTDDATAALLAYPWPGNVRELANVLERAALLSRETRLGAADLGLPATPPPPERVDAGAPASEEETRGERQRLLDVLKATAWNFTRAAARLGLPRNTLRYRAGRLGLEPRDAARRRGGRPAADRAGAGPSVEPRDAEPAIHQTRRVTLLRARLAEPATTRWELMRALQESGDKVRSFGGRIEETTPHALLAAFGLDPDEEAPRRATYAALAVHTLFARAGGKAGATPVAVGLHTEFLPLTRQGETARLDPSALGEARRSLDTLLAGAEATGVVATAAASRFLARRFELAPLPGGGDARRVVRHAEPGRTAFVGRERELRLLLESFETARAGQGQVVMVAGEPGIGKTRLLHELRRRLGREATWVEGQALSFGRSIPFHPVIDMLRRVCRIDEADSEAVIIDKIDRTTRRLGVTDDRTRACVRYLLSVDPGDPGVLAMDPKHRHAAIVEATHRLAELGSELRPHVVVLEDLHWCDPATEDWVTRLADRIVNRRVLLVMTYRPGYRPGLGHRPFHTALSLPTLSSEESLRIARDLLDVDELPAELQRLVLAKAEGNPFFIEELTRSLQEQGVVRRDGGRLVLGAALERVAVPDTVEEVILDRTHRLDDRLREVLEVAAVIGAQVPFGLLQAVTGRDENELLRDVHRLQAAEFLVEKRVFPEVEHAFKHALTQDVAYGRVAPERRRELHARIVDAIEATYPERLDEHVERLAYHATRGERWAQAVRYGRLAGTKAFDRSANREAVASFEGALTALAALPESPATLAEAVDIRLAMRSALLQLAETARIEQILREAETVALALGDHPRLAWVRIYRSIAHLFSGDPREALALGERTLVLVEDIGDAGLRATARTPLAHACHELGDYRRAVELCRETIEALRDDPVPQRLGQAIPPAGYARCIITLSLAELGEFAEAERFASEAAALTTTGDLPFGYALARTALGQTEILRGRPDHALRALDEALEVMERRGLPTWQPWGVALRGYARVLSGRVDEGTAGLERGIERAAALPYYFGHAQWIAWLAHAHLLGGRVDEAWRRGEEALALAQRMGTRGGEAWALYALAEAAARRGARDAARDLGRRARALADELGMRPLAERCRAID